MANVEINLVNRSIKKANWIGNLLLDLSWNLDSLELAEAINAKAALDHKLIALLASVTTEEGS